MELIIEKSTVDKLLKFMNSKIEVGGNFKYSDGYLTLGPIYYGDRYHIDFDQTVSAFNFHTHPIEKVILHSFYSQGDIIAALRRQSISDKIRKDILVTEDGIYSIQLSPKLMSLYKKFPDQLEFLLGLYQRLSVQPKMVAKETGDWNELRAKYACNIVKMVKQMNTLDGKILFEWMLDEINKGRVSFRDSWQLASYIKMEKFLTKLDKIYYVYFMPWGKKEFRDTFAFLPRHEN